MSSETPTRNYPLIVGGVLLILFGLLCLFFPGATLMSIALMAGVGFLFAGIMDIVTYARDREVLGLSGWFLAYGILDVVIGLMFIVHPVATATIIPWLIAAFIIVFAVFEIVESVAMRKAGSSLWGWVLVSGILSGILGVLFFTMPILFAYYIAFFALLRGVGLIIFGLSYKTTFLS